MIAKWQRLLKSCKLKNRRRTAPQFRQFNGDPFGPSAKRVGRRLSGSCWHSRVLSALAVQVRDSMQEESASVAYCVGENTHEAAFLIASCPRKLRGRFAMAQGAFANNATS